MQFPANMITRAGACPIGWAALALMMLMGAPTLARSTPACRCPEALSFDSVPGRITGQTLYLQAGSDPAGGYQCTWYKKWNGWNYQVSGTTHTAIWIFRLWYENYSYDTHRLQRNDADPVGDYQDQCGAGGCLGHPVNIRGSSSCGYGVKPTNTTAAATPYAESTDDPIQVATGEFYTPEVPLFKLGGPLPLAFSVAFASRSKAEGAPMSALGWNWRHNFDLRLTFNAERQFIRLQYLGGRNIYFWQTSDYPLRYPEPVAYVLKKDAGGDYWFQDPKLKRLYQFDGATGRLETIMDRNGNTLTVNYNAQGGLAEILDGLGRTLTFTHNGDLIAQVTDGTRTVTFAHTASVLESITDKTGAVTAFAYDTSSDERGPLMLYIQHPKGNRHATQVYDASGRVSTQEDAYGNTLTLRYDTPQPGMTTLIDALGNSRGASHAEGQRQTSRHDAEGRTATATYDDKNRLESVTDTQGKTTRQSYIDRTGMVASRTDALGNVVSNAISRQTQTFTHPVSGDTVTFDFWPLVEVNHPDGTKDQHKYDDRGNLIERTDRAGGIWTTTFNSQGLPLVSTNPAGGSVTRTYNPDGTLASVKDSETDSRAYGYDALGRRTATTLPDGSQERTTYDAGDRVIAVTDGRSFTTSYSYDENGNLVAMTDALGATTRYTFDLMDRMSAITDRMGGVTAMSYDRLGRKAATTDPNGLVTRYGYDRRGFKTSITVGGRVWQTSHDEEGIEQAHLSPAGHRTTYQTDALGRMMAVVNPHNEKLTFTRDSMGRILSITDHLGRIDNKTYDARGLLASASAPVIGQALYSRNSLGLLSGITDLNGQSWTFTHSAMGRMTGKSDPLSRKTTLSHDNSGRLHRITYADGTVFTRHYDALGNVTREEGSSGLVLNYSYDGLNRLLSAEDLTLSRDSEGRVTSALQGGVAFGASYDEGGRLKALSYGNALTVTYSHDETTGLLHKVKDNLTQTALTLTHDADGRLTGLQRPNGVNGTYHYDGVGRLTRITEGSLFDLQYGLDGAGQVTLVEQTGLTLAQEDWMSPDRRVLSFDGASQISAQEFTFDARGRQTAAPGWSFEWDGASRLVKHGTTAMGYNGLHDPVLHTARGTTRRFFYNYALKGRPLAAERNEEGQTFIRYYIWTPQGRLLYLIDAASGNKVRHYHFDRRGTTLALSDASGNRTDAYTYAPYGQVLRHEGTSTQPFTFVGQWGVRQNDSLGRIYHMGARYYDAALARFLSRDPLWPRIEDPRSLNPYGYARQNPVGFVDIDGREAKPTLAVKEKMRRNILKKIGQYIDAAHAGDRGAGLAVAGYLSGQFWNSGSGEMAQAWCGPRWKWPSRT